MSDLTLVLGPEWSRFSKRVAGIDEIDAADQLPAYLQFDECALTDVDDLYATLNALRSERNTCVIRGQLIKGTEQPCRRLLKARTEEGVHYPATFEDAARSWLMVDFDSVPEPDGVDFAAQPARCASYLRAQLPSPFAQARCVWHASGSAGFKPGVRLHLWFLLDRALTGDECKAWLSHSKLPVDRTVYGAVQPHYTADPLLVGELVDPMSERMGVLAGASERVAVPTTLPADIHAKTVNQRTLATVRDTRDVDPFVRMGLARWESDHPWDGGEPDLSERFECPACSSSDGCAVLPDGKLFCHGGKHAYEAANVGHAANNGYVMHRFEAFEKCAWRDVPKRLQELGYYPGAPTKRLQQSASVSILSDAGADARVEAAVETMTAVAQGAPTASLSAIKRARKDMLECARCITADQERAEQIAFAFARKHVPASFTPLAARKGLVEHAKLFDESVEVAIARGLERAATTPDEERVSAVSLDLYGKAERSLANVATLMHLPDFADTLAFDERAQQIVLTTCPPWLAAPDAEFPRTIQDADYPAIAVYLSQRCDYTRATVSDIREALTLVALSQPYDPVVEYLDGLPAWEGSLEDAREACGSWLQAFASAEDNSFTRAATMRWMISAVARAYSPGCQQREVLTLVGPQNIGKSKLLESLAGRKWFKDDLSLHRNPEMGLLGNWIVELAELDKLTAQDRHGELKAFISTATDKYRAPYARNFVQVPRRSVFAGTANPTEIFRDPTGNTRFNVLALGSQKIDFVGLAEARDDLWCAARMLYKVGEPWWLQADEQTLAVERQEAHRERGDAEEYLRDLLENPWVPVPGDISGFRVSKEQLDADRLIQWISTSQMVQYLTDKHIHRNVHKQIAHVMRAINWTYKRHVGGRLGERGYSRE